MFFSWVCTLGSYQAFLVVWPLTLPVSRWQTGGNRSPHPVQGSSLLDKTNKSHWLASTEITGVRYTKNKKKGEIQCACNTAASYDKQSNWDFSLHTYSAIIYNALLLFRGRSVVPLRGATNDSFMITLFFNLLIIVLFIIRLILEIS